MDPWMIDASSGEPSYGAQEVRLATSALLGPNGTPLGVRSGVKPSGGTVTDLSVLAQATPNMTVRVLPGSAIVQGASSSSQGAYIYTLDTTKTVTIAAAHPSQQRIDRICVRIRDSTVDTSGARDGDIVPVAGTAGGGVPSLPTDATYVELAQVTIPANAVNIGGAGQGTIADKRTFVASAGGVLYAPSSANLPAANTVPPGTIRYQGDVSTTAGRFSYSDGSNWLYLDTQGPRITAWAPQNNVAGTTTSTAYTDTLTGSTPVSVSFSVPGSGRVEITITADIVNASGRAYMSYRLSGGTTAAATDAWALMNAGTGTIRASTTYLHTGLDFGTIVTATLQHRATAGTATFDARRIHVTPVL